jgi:hypothetical protein
MIFFKRIKQLEAQVAELKTRNQILEDRTEILAGRMAKGFEEIDQLYSHLVSHEHSAEKPVTIEKPASEQKPRRYRQRRKNGKETAAAE